MQADLEAIRPKPQELVLAQYIEHEEHNLSGPNPYWYAPNLWKRWLVRLDCGCVTEALTPHDYGPPTECKDSETLGDPPIYKQTHIMHPYQFEDGRPGSVCMFGGQNGTPFRGPGGCCHPKGTMWCSAHDDKLPWREVVQWIHRNEHYYEGKSSPYWDVILSCGHCYGPNTADPEWSPGMPPSLNIEWIKKLRRRLSTEWKDRHDDGIRDLREQVEHNGFMVCRPAIEEECPECAYLRQIIEYRLIGPLSDKPWKPPAKPEPKPPPTAEEMKDRKLRRLRRIESELARLQTEADRLRREAGE